MDVIENYVFAISEELNISRAAKRLAISQPALSAALTKHEKSLGYSIFDRERTPLALTSEGKIYLDFLKCKLNLENNLKDRIADLDDERQKELRIGAPIAYVNPFILPAVTRLLKECPSCKLKICEGTVPSLKEMALKGDLDLFISTTDSISDRFNLQKVSEERVYLCSPKRIKLNSDNIPDLSGLKDEYFIELGAEQPLQIQVDQFLKGLDFAPSKTIEVDQISSSLQLVQNGCGICFATTSSLLECNQATGFYTYRMPDSIFRRNLYLASFKYNNLTSVQQKFVNIITEIGENLNEKN